MRRAFISADDDKMTKFIIKQQFSSFYDVTLDDEETFLIFCSRLPQNLDKSRIKIVFIRFETLRVENFNVTLLLHVGYESRQIMMILEFKNWSKDFFATDNGNSALTQNAEHVGKVIVLEPVYHE